MQNFDYLSKYPELSQLYSYCRDAENFQLVAPEKSVVGARKALEFWAKMVYMVNGWDMPDKPSLMELLITQQFIDYIGDATVMDNIHFIRRIGNNGAHGKSVKPAAALHCLACLHALIGEWLMLIGVIDDIPHFDPSLVPTVITLSVVSNDGDPVLSTDSLQQYAKKSEGKTLHPTTPHVLSELETRRLYIDLMLAEAGWVVQTTHNAIVPGTACVEVELAGMPNQSAVGFADYVLFSQSLQPLAVIEAKRTLRDSREGRHQAELYAGLLERHYGVRPVIYYSNGYETYVQDGLGYPDRRVFSFHSEDDLQLLIQKRGRQDITDLTINTDITNRDYQMMAVHKVCDHLNGKHRRGLIVMATGTGKTRVSISLVDVLMRNNWAKNVLFLADRRSLVKQAWRNFNKLLPSNTTTILSENKEPDMKARIMFSTYQTMIRYIDAKAKEVKPFSIGRFDLIIIDEAHRSVFGKYGAIFDYFDSLLIGLTATPREDVDKSTYQLLQLEEGEPNFTYELQEAITDHYLVGYRAYQRSSKIMTEGIRYDQLSKKEQEEFEDIWEYEKALKALDPRERYTRDIESSEIYSYLFNIDTVDHVLQDLMENGLRVEDGERLGKTIIFAINHKHAQMIVDRFAVLYPQLAAQNYCVLIDNTVEYGDDLVEKFSIVSEEAPAPFQIAVSVDMLDTGIDVPDCLNLVFFKKVRSKIKFNQMIGRGTRTCKDVFGPGRDKTEFLIFDWCGNFEYFNSHPQGAEPANVLTITMRIFNLRMDIAVLLQDARYSEQEGPAQLCEGLKDILHGQVSVLENNRIDVRRHWGLIDRFRSRDAWQYISEVDAHVLKRHVAPLIFMDDTDLAAKKFDVICLLLQLSLLDESVDGNRPMEKICALAKMLEKRNVIPQVAMHMPLIREVQTAVFWEKLTTSVAYGLDSMERVRVDLRSLMKYLVGMERKTFDIDIADVISDEGLAKPINIQVTYQQRVLDYLAENSKNDYILQKIYNLDPLSESDIRKLEQIFWEQLGTRKEYEETYLKQEKYKLYGGNIAAFIRSCIGVDREVARNKFINLLQASGVEIPRLTPMQEEYLRTILNYVCTNGDIETTTMSAQEPFVHFEWQDTFGESFQSLVRYVRSLHNVINVA